MVRLKIGASQVRSRVVPRSGVQNLREGSSREIRFGRRWTAQVREGFNEGEATEYFLSIPKLTVMISASPTEVVTPLSLGRVLAACQNPQIKVSMRM